MSNPNYKAIKYKPNAPKLEAMLSKINSKKYHIYLNPKINFNKLKPTLKKSFDQLMTYVSYEIGSLPKKFNSKRLSQNRAQTYITTHEGNITIIWGPYPPDDSTTTNVLVYDIL